VLKLVSNWLSEEDAQWLMILDNADNPELFFSSNDVEQSFKKSSVLKQPLTDFLPSRLSCQKLLLITTRRGNLGEDLSKGEQCIEVPPFNVPESRLLLQQRSKGVASGDDSPESVKLLGILENIPLAITQAAAFIRQNKMSLAKYLAALEKDDENLKNLLSVEFQDARRDRGLPSAVFRTWKLSFSQIHDQKPRAAQMLSLMALFDRREIPESLLKHPEDKDVDFLIAIATLRDFSLIVQEVDNQTFAMHRLVQLSIHNWLEQAGKKVKYEEQALQRLADHFPFPQHENIKTCRQLYPHAQAVLRYNLRSESYLKARASLLHVMGWYAMDQGNLDIAEMQTLEALTLYEETVGRGSAQFLNCRDILGSIFYHRGKYKEAEEMHKQTLGWRESRLGKTHVDTQTSMYKIAQALNKQGKYDEAMKMLMETLKLSEVSQGKDHPEMLTVKHSLASTLSHQGKHKEAEEILVYVLKMSEAILGKEHPSTLATMQNLAKELGQQQKYAEAEDIYLQVLESEEIVLGKKHPDTLMTMHNLAWVLDGQQKYKEAEEIFLLVLELRETVLEKKHPDTLETVWNLAHLYETEERYEEAEVFYQRATTGFQEVLGPDHPNTVGCIKHHESFLKKWEIERSKTAE
jgi:tetratricopeptide (TPR) repeat protein